MANKKGNSTEGMLKANTFKCEEALVAFIVREINSKGEVIAERQTDPVKVFRASDGANIWAAIDLFTAQQK